MTNAAALHYRKADNRRVLAVDGPDAADFLQGLLTNDVGKAAPDVAVYAALLTPQGKFLAEMMVTRPAPTRFLLDLDAATAAGVMQRLGMYRLRAAVTLEPLREGSVWRIWGAPASELDLPGTSPDPRSGDLGRIAIVEKDTAAAAFRSAFETAGASEASAAEWRRVQIEACVPLSGDDLVPNESYPLELDFERLHGVDFRKGCYVGQEVTARMKHKATLKKGLRRLRIEGAAPAPGSDLIHDGKVAGRMGGGEGASGLALLRLDRVGKGDVLTAGDASLTVAD